MRKRTRPFQLRLSDEEWEILQEKAKELGVTMSTYVRLLIFGKIKI